MGEVILANFHETKIGILQCIDHARISKKQSIMQKTNGLYHCKVHRKQNVESSTAKWR